MLKPLKHRILIQRDAAPTETTGGLFIPDQAQSKETVGTVLELGKDADDILKVGQRVVFGQHDGVEIASEYCDGRERCLIIADNQVKYIVNGS